LKPERISQTQRGTGGYKNRHRRRNSQMKERCKQSKQKKTSRATQYFGAAQKEAPWKIDGLGADR